MTNAKSDFSLLLYNWPTSTCSQKVRMCLNYKGLSWDERILDWKNDEHLSAWYLELNPNGVVPTLVHDGKIVTDSSVINEYLEEVFPEPGLLPKDAWGKAQVRAWRQFIDEVPTPAIRIPSMNNRVAPVFAQLGEDEYRDRVQRRTIRRHFYARMGKTGFAEAEVIESLERLRDTVQRMETALERSPWLAGRQMTIADISIAPTIVRMEDTGLRALWADCPHVVQWYARIQAEPCFKATFHAGARHEGTTYRPDLLAAVLQNVDT